MEPLMWTAGIVTVGAITPGPNNIIIMRETARAGWRAAVSAMAGIVSGGLALVWIVAGGAGAIFERQPHLVPMLTLVCGGVLAGFGSQLILRSSARSAGSERAAGRGFPTRGWGLFVFQLINPKAWALVLTVVSVTQASYTATASLIYLTALFLFVPTLCLVLWSGFGLVMMRYLSRGSVRLWFDRVIGLVFLACAALVAAAGVRDLMP